MRSHATLGSGSLLLFAALLPGCSMFLPAHAHSNRREGEQVHLQMLTAADVQADAGFQARYQAAFGRAVPRPPAAGPAMAPGAGALAALAVGLVVDAVEKRLREEATLYEAQFSITRAVDQFWSTISPPSQNYVGFRMRREVAGGSAPAFELEVGIAPSADQVMFRLAPLLFVTRQAKAKVLSDAAWTWAPPVVFGKLFDTAGHEIDSTVAIEVEGYWRDKDQRLLVSRLAAMEWSFPSYDIAASPTLAPPGAPVGASGWLLGVPVSRDPADNAVGNGTFALRVVVTERDRSNAKAYLEQGAKLLAEQKPKLVEAVSGD